MTACVAETDEIEEAAEPEGEGETESAVTAPQLLGQWSYWIPFNSSQDITHNVRCTTGRTRSHFTVGLASGSGHCDPIGFIDQFDQGNCSVRFHIGANWNESGWCHLRIFETPANVVIFTGQGFTGASKRFDPGAYNMGSLGIPNDSLRSLRVPPGWTATLFQHSDFNAGDPTGWVRVFTNDTSVLTEPFVDRNTSSMIVTKVPGAPN